MMKLIQLAAISAILTGCATTPKILTVDGADISPLKTERAVVSYKLVDKRINYHENLYRVLWVEQKYSTQDFSGIWSADQDLTNYAVEALRAKGLKADSLYEVADSKSIEAVNAVETVLVRRSATVNDPYHPGVKMLPQPMYFADIPTERPFTDLAEQLRSKGYRYMIEMTAMDLVGDAGGLGNVTLFSLPNMRVIDLKINKVVWNQSCGHFERMQLGGDLKMLEADNMAKTKESMRTGIGKMDFLALWSL